MVTIHEKTAQAFNTLGLGALTPSSCAVTEELNGVYEMELKHPYDDTGKWERIENGRILYASTPRGMQPFRIYNITPNMESITVNARHIFYDLLDNSCGKINAGNAADAVREIKDAFAYSMPFTFSTDISTSGTMKCENFNPVQALLADESDNDSFVKIYGGELLRDGFSVSMKASIGENRDVAIRYGKNLIGLEITENDGDVKTRIIGRRKGRDVFTLDSPYLKAYPYPRIHIISDDNISESRLREQAQELLDGGIDIPTVNIKVDFIPLANTVEYRNYAPLEEVFLGDKITIINEKMGFAKQAKVISYEWDCLLEQYNTVELGNFLPMLTTAVTSGTKTYATADRAAVNATEALNQLHEHLQDFSNPHRVTAEQIGNLSGFATLEYVNEQLQALKERISALENKER